jgi:hypothetical protein
MLEEKDKNLSLKTLNEQVNRKYDALKNDMFELSMKAQD